MISPWNNDLTGKLVKYDLSFILSSFSLSPFLAGSVSYSLSMWVCLLQGKCRLKTKQKKKNHNFLCVFYTSFVTAISVETISISFWKLSICPQKMYLKLFKKLMSFCQCRTQKCLSQGLEKHPCEIFSSVIQAITMRDLTLLIQWQEINMFRIYGCKWQSLVSALGYLCWRF